MLWLILGFSWLASVVLILSLLGAVRETENESLAVVSFQSRFTTPVRPTRRVA
jgi:hypothetical protein